MVKTQVIISVSTSLALMLQMKKMAKEVWGVLVDEMTKKPTWLSQIFNVSSETSKVLKMMTSESI